MIVEERTVDTQGRVSLPAEWRKKHLTSNGKVTVTQKGNEIIIVPVNTKQISELFDSIPVNIQSDLSDWKKVKKELLTGEAP
ncbi:MAG: AbrB/MazE/SpoVT family DNA-binding domain-containing protein [Candidatus Bathyarchaeota archaeon]|nr:AbrB/MazE/SpoVT family DNA-binding domain-containing protein [Candidatus Bathyarchaeota archaeon]